MTTTEPVSLPDAMGAFTLSITEAAQALALRPTELIDLISAGIVPALLVPADMITERPPLRIAPGLLPLIAERLEASHTESDAAEVLTVSRALRRYLVERTPLDRYEEARKQGHPVLAKDRLGQIYAHIQADTFTAWLCDREGFMFGSKVRRALERLGATYFKSLHGIDDGRQHWHAWWRLPSSFWAVNDEQVFQVPEIARTQGAGR